MEKPTALKVISIILIIYGALILTFGLIGAPYVFKELNFNLSRQIFSYVGFLSYLLSIITGITLLMGKKTRDILVIVIIIKILTNLLVGIDILNGGVIVFGVFYARLYTLKSIKDYYNNREINSEKIEN